MDKAGVAKNIYEVAHITGKFKLRSGQISDEYFDKYLFEAEPELLVEIAKIMKPLIPLGTEIIAGLEMGGIPVVTALSEYGTCKLAEGADVTNKNICIVEDVVTTGGQIIESVRELRQRGAKVDTVLCVILRDEKAVKLLADEGLKLIPAFTMEYIKEQI